MSPNPIDLNESPIKKKSLKYNISDTIFGFLALSVVVYRIVVFFVPEIMKAVKNKDTFQGFRSLVLLV